MAGCLRYPAARAGAGTCCTLAIELADFAHAVTTGAAPETDGLQGLRSLAIAYGILEADRLGRTVTVDELMSGTAIPHQDAIVGGSAA